MGFRGVTLNWIKSYVSNRVLHTQIGDNSSFPSSPTIGVPQGSILGPLLFILYVADMPNAAPLSRFIMFADDTTLYYTHPNIHDCVNIINGQLSLLVVWLNANKLSLNVDKTVGMIFSNKPVPPNVKISINNSSIQIVNNSKFLGLDFDNKFNCSRHTALISNKISKLSGIFRKLSLIVPPNIRINLDNSLLEPCLLYTSDAADE